MMDLTTNTLNQFLQYAIFYFFSALAILSAIMMIIAKNPVRSVLSLVVTFFSIGTLWILLEAEFLAMTLVLVYVGAVMVLFIFVIMMLDIEYAALTSGFARYLPVGLMVALLMAGGIIYAVSPTQLTPSYVVPATLTAEKPSATALGILLYSNYLFPFEIAGILLLVAIIAAISLTFRGRQQRKVQDPGAQIKVQKEDRLTIVKMSRNSSPLKDLV